jgi:hypothetical protein
VAQPIGTQVLLPINTATQIPIQIELSALKLQDQCGDDAALDTAGQAGTCFNLTFAPNGGTVDCFEGSCHPATCADYHSTL